LWVRRRRPRDIFAEGRTFTSTKATRNSPREQLTAVGGPKVERLMELAAGSRADGWDKPAANTKAHDIFRPITDRPNDCLARATVASMEH